MTSLHSPLARTTARQEPRQESELRQALVTRRPLVPTATLGGALAAAGPLLVCMAVAVVGWFLTDAGGHGTPSGALRVGALGWLAAHGSGVAIEGIRITAVPLGITLLSVWSAWRVGHRVGESISGHGPDAERIADGERDWTVAFAGGLFTTGYVLVGVLATTLASTIETAPSTGRVVLWSTVIAAGAGLPALARGSGRAAIWVPAIPVAIRDTAVLVRSILRAWLAVALVALLVALVLDFSTAANIVSQLDSGAGDIAMLGALTLVVLPNAMLFSSSYLLGPGFTVGTGTLVSPGLVVLGPLPLFPLLAALPDGGPTPAWAGWLIVTPVLIAACGLRPGPPLAPRRRLGPSSDPWLRRRTRRRPGPRLAHLTGRRCGGARPDGRRRAVPGRRAPALDDRLRHRWAAGCARDDLVAATRW